MLARARVEDELAWSHQREAYVGVYRPTRHEGIASTATAFVVRGARTA